MKPLPGLSASRFGVFLLFAVSASSVQAGPGVWRIYEPATAFRLTLDGTRRRFLLEAGSLGLRFGGPLGGSPEGTGLREGRDGIGPYRSVTFCWWEGLPRKGEIRIYEDRPVVLFLEGWPRGAERPGSAFPVLDEFPGGFYGFCYADRVFAPPRFRLERTSSPWFFFKEDGTSFLVGPASDFMVAEMRGDGKTRIVSGLGRELRDLPPGYTHATLLAAGRSIDGTWDLWGKALTDFQGRKRPGPWADSGLECLGYWTDNGAACYYDFDLRKGYEKTLLDLMGSFRREGIPYRYLQLDSWFYPKSFTYADGSAPAVPRPKNPRLPAGRWNRYGGMLLYQADPAVFPRGLGEFRRKLGLPLVTHDRWIDVDSPYRKSYRISGVGAVDPAWWDHVIGNLASWGVVTYEQDWLNVIYGFSPEMRKTVWAGRAFMDGMARACRAKGLTMQYCMAQPRHFLQGSRYDNLTTIRVSGDRFEQRKWRHALFTSRLAWTVGIYPWVDVFRSSELGNLLLACLSAGMVGPGDAEGEESVENLAMVCRSDGVLVKPDAPLLPVRESWVAAARGEKSSLVAATCTDFGGFRADYVFLANFSREAFWADLPPASMKIRRPCFVYRPFVGKGVVLHSGETWRARIEGKRPGARNWGYFIVVPWLGKGLALVGDRGKMVPLGRKRVESVRYEKGGLQVTVRFARGEREVTLAGVSSFRPEPSAVEGRISSLVWNPVNRKFLLSLVPGTGGAARVVIPCD